MGALRGAACGALLLVFGSAAAEAETINFGARADVPPMSWRSEDGKLRGYAIDVCEHVKKTFRRLYPDRAIADEYVEVTAANRRQRLLSGDVRTVCGAFTMTIERMATYDFSFLTFASGASVATRRRENSVLQPLGSLKDERPARVVVVSETTTETLVQDLLGTAVTVTPVATHYAAFEALEKGRADYYFGDRVVLDAVIGRSPDANAFRVGGKFLTYEPYAMPFVRGRDPELLLAANRAIADLYRSGAIMKIYEGHFGEQRAGDLVRSLYQLYAVPVE